MYSLTVDIYKYSVLCNKNSSIIKKNPTDMQLQRKLRAQFHLDIKRNTRYKVIFF